MKKPFIAVIGKRNSGKSTVIRSLTGCASKSAHNHEHGFFVAEDRVKNKTIYVRANSPQEAPLTLDKLQDIIQEVKDRRSLGVVMAIQPNKLTRRLSMEDIRNTVQDSGVFQIYAFVLDPGYKDEGASNSIFEETERRLNEAGIQVQICARLDGRRFAFNNAMEINRCTKLWSAVYSYKGKQYQGIIDGQSHFRIDGEKPEDEERKKSVAFLPSVIDLPCSVCHYWGHF